LCFHDSKNISNTIIPTYYTYKLIHFIVVSLRSMSFSQVSSLLILRFLRVASFCIIFRILYDELVNDFPFMGNSRLRYQQAKRFLFDFMGKSCAIKNTIPKKC